MPDQSTHTATTGYGSRIVSSIKGIIFGVILFVVSFGVLYWNEGRADLSVIAKTAIEINAQTQNTDASLNGNFIFASGIVNSEQIISDNLFLKPDRYMAVKRKVEMYAWVEKTERRSKTNIGGSETTEKTYTYSLEWTEHPKPSSNFKYPKGRNNPQKTLDSSITKATIATVGVYSFSLQSATLPNFSKLPISSQNVILSQDVMLASDSYLFIRKSENGTFGNPRVGDLRISYSILRPNFEGTIFGKLNGSKIDPYFDKDNNRLYRVFAGTRDEAIATLHSEYKTSLWIFRLVGFLMMWIGLSLLFGPISVLMDILPIFGSISRMVIGIITFALSLTLTIVAIIISMILHSLAALIISLVVVIAAIIIAVIMRKKKQQAAQSFSSPTDQ